MSCYWVPGFSGFLSNVYVFWIIIITGMYVKEFKKNIFSLLFFFYCIVGDNHVGDEF